MSDLGTYENKRQQRRRAHRERLIPEFARGRDEYFQWAIRSGEYFQLVTVQEYRNGIRHLIKKMPAKAI